MKSIRDWPRARKRLALSLAGLLAVLFLVYVSEAFLKVRRTRLSMIPSEDSTAPLPEGEDGQAPGRPDRRRELEAGVLNHEPAMVSFLFRQAGTKPEEDCQSGCLDQAVAPNLVLFLVSAEGQMCRARTKNAFLWKTGAEEFPVTPLELDRACERMTEAEFGVFAMERPRFSPIRLQPAPEPSTETPQTLAAVAPLRERIRTAVGTLEDSVEILPLTAQETVLSVAEGPLKLRVQRWLEKRGAGSEGLLRSGLVEYGLGGRSFRPLGQENLACGEIRAAFRLDGDLFLVLEQDGCHDGVRCRSFQRWLDGAFTAIDGSCSFSQAGAADGP